MNANSKAKLVEKIQDWLDDERVSDDLGGNCAMWQDVDATNKNAHLMADAVEICVRAASLQSELDDELNN